MWSSANPNSDIAIEQLVLWNTKYWFKLQTWTRRGNQYQTSDRLYHIIAMAPRASDPGHRVSLVLKEENVKIAGSLKRGRDSDLMRQEEDKIK
jgi:hypothetical protein